MKLTHYPYHLDDQLTHHYYDEFLNCYLTDIDKNHGKFHHNVQ